MTKLTCLASLVFSCLTGCGGHAVDLDHAPPASSGSSPTNSAPATVLSNDDFRGVWADEQRLYWLASAGGLWRLQSCIQTDCERTKLTYVQSTQKLQATVADGRVYWTSESSFFSCPAGGCQGKPARITQDPAAGVDPIFAHRDYVYWSSDFDLYRCPAAGCAETPELVASNTTSARLVFDEKRAYWIDTPGISSAPKDGSEPPKLEIAQRPDGDSIDSLAIAADYLYWAAGAHVFRCQLPDCGASPPATRVTAAAPVTELEIDEQTIYWLESDAVHSCPLSGCEESLTLTAPKVTRTTGDPWERVVPFAVDSKNLFWIEGIDSPESPLPERGQAIRRTAK